MDSLRLSKLETYESTVAVRCLICNRKFDCKGIGEVTIDQFAKEIDDNPRRLGKKADLQVLERFTRKGEQLKKRMRKHSIANASSLFFVGRK